MNKIKRFEDLECWKVSRTLVQKLYNLTESETFSKDFTLCNQVKRAVLSSMTNIAEGFTRSHKNDFIRFLDFSQSSVAEVKSLLYVARDQRYISQEDLAALHKSCDQCRFMTLSLIKQLQKKERIAR